jgi:hypothetical protein
VKPHKVSGYASVVLSLKKPVYLLVMQLQIRWILLRIWQTASASRTARDA